MAGIKKIAYYVTPHGFGHAVRSLEVVRCLLDLHPHLEISLVADIPEFLVQQNAGRKLPLFRRRLDFGLVQQDSLRFDLERTLSGLLQLHRDRARLLDREYRFQKDLGLSGVISDIPFIPFQAAAMNGVPSVGVSNFTWDWIYQTYGKSDPRWRRPLAWIRDCYRACSVLLQLPMHGDCSVCPTIEPVPLIGRKAKMGPEQVREILPLKDNAILVLLSFTDLELAPAVQRRLGALADIVFLIKKPLRLNLDNGLSLDEFPELGYADAIAASDLVITKPGYGIVSDCLASGTPMIYTDRGEFPEYPILVAAIETQLTNVYLPSADLYAGRWRRSIEAVSNRPVSKPPVPVNGAHVCAERISAIFNL